MRKIAVLLIFTFLVNCNDDVEPVGNSNGDVIEPPFEITQISFKADLNATLFEDIVLDFDGVEFFTAVIPYGVDIKSLIPSIVTNPENGFIKLDEINYQKIDSNGLSLISEIILNIIYKQNL